jgi:hypothetical protein
MSRWRWRGSVALLAVGVAFLIFPLLPQDDVINSDWPAFATGARLIVSDPGHLYDLATQQHVQAEVTGGRVLITPGIEGILPFLAPAWVALLAVPFDAFGTDLGGRMWILFGLVSLLAGLYLATRPRPPATILPAFASVPTALLMLNAHLDGLVVLGVGASISLWPRRYLAGLALGLTLVKPQLMLPLGVAVLIAREWRVLAGWLTAGLVLLVPTLVLNSRWPLDWLAQTRATVAPVSREVDLPHLGVLLPSAYQGVALLLLTAVAVGVVFWLAWRVRGQKMRPAIGILIAGGVLASPHALAADLVLVALAMAIWGQARWYEWLALSVVALACALVVPPLPSFLGILLIGWLLGRASGVISKRPEPGLASPR